MRLRLLTAAGALLKQQAKLLLLLLSALSLLLLYTASLTAAWALLVRECLGMESGGSAWSAAAGTVGVDGAPAALMPRKILSRVLLAASMCCKLRGLFMLPSQLLHCWSAGLAHTVDTSRLLLLLRLQLRAHPASACARRRCLLDRRQSSSLCCCSATSTASPLIISCANTVANSFTCASSRRRAAPAA